ncbi:hypothetical protein CN204_04430 [Sinorhizobium meliloti]|uniref:hypothetical protein n=1 Tax=Rhizobium meliloti TaxID=382 RepID=UPI000FDA9FB9|nr:hypothetical protein [Sinorhizobium meliloti]RVH87781.1 hypothetical protein CN204_04430 [Sinorhizobium meliloti]
MALKHPEYAHGISDAELMKEALEFCDEELAGFIGMEYDSDSEVCCQRSDTFIRELVHRLSPAPETRTAPADTDAAQSGGEDKPVICIGHHTIGQLMAGNAVEIDAAIMIPASDLSDPEPGEHQEVLDAIAAHNSGEEE